MNVPVDPKLVDDPVQGPEPSPEELYPCVRPEVARLLVELDQRQLEIQARADRAMADFERPRGIMGKLFGLRTSVG